MMRCLLSILIGSWMVLPLHAQDITLRSTLRGHSMAIRSVAFSPDGKMLVSASQDKTLKLWNVDSGQCIGTLRRSESTCFSVAFSPDGTVIASADNSYKEHEQFITLWDVATSKIIATLNSGECFLATWVTFSPNGKTLAMATGQTQTVELWDVAAKKKITTLKMSSGNTNCVAFSPDSKTLATATGTQVVLHDMATNKDTANEWHLNFCKWFIVYGL